MNSAELYREAFVLDCNALESIGAQFDDPARLQDLHDSGVSALKTTLGGANGTFEEAVADIVAAQALIERLPEHFIKVRGHGCLDGETGGLTVLGRDAITRMNELGVALDLSHSNTQTTAEGIAASRKPPLITHAGCRAVFMHPRNKRDEEMKALADRGGVMGIYMLPFLTPDDRQPMLADYMRHMIHALDVCGEDHVGIGTDTAFFTVTDAELEALRTDADDRRKQGVGAPGENRPPYLPDINTPRKLERVADALLEYGYPASVADKVLGLNFSRVLKEIWTA